MKRKLAATLYRRIRHLVLLSFVWSWLGVAPTIGDVTAADNPNPPTSPVKLIFIHHSTGGNWLADANDSSPYGELGKALMNNNYYVSATNYGWGPDGIGDRTDIVNWPEWFTGANHTAILTALYAETGQNIQEFGAWTRMATDPGGLNRIVLFKSCFPNSNLTGNPTDPAYAEPNDWEYSVANAKAVYNRLLTYFATRQDKLFVVITAPPLNESEYPEDAQTPAARAANARAFNNWLVNNWLTGYAHSNVAVFDYYNVLTSNGGSPEINDVGQATGNHHRWWNGAVQHIQSVNNNFPAYPSGDSHPGTAGHRKATAEFLPLLNVFYHRWQSGIDNPPGKAVLISPTGTIATNKPAYAWNAVTNSSYYYLWVNDATGNKIKKWFTAAEAGCASGAGTCTVTPSTSLATGSGQWWIQTWNSYGYGPWSSTMNFTVRLGTKPDAATLVSPKGTIATSKPSYVWNAVSNATWYYLWVNDPAGAKVKIWYTAAQAGCAAGTGQCTVTPTNTLSNGNHTWWIQTWNDYGYGPWSTALNFMVNTAAGNLIQPGDFSYVGAFRLLDEGERPKTFEYGGGAMTFNPAGDPSGPEDGFSGSLFIMGHNRMPYGDLPDGNQVAEVTIPVPTIQAQVRDLNQAAFIQNFQNVANGFFTNLDEIPRVGMAYLNHQATGPRIHLSWGQNIQDETTASHAWFSPTLSTPNMKGTWFIGNQSVYSVNDYIFEIPSAWADAHVGGRYLGTGRFKDGGWSGMGPALFAYRPWIDSSGTPAPSGTHLQEKTLLLYEKSTNTENIEKSLQGYQHPDEWSGGQWITTSSGKAGVLFAGNKSVGTKYWYGYLNPSGAQYPCVDADLIGQFTLCRMANGQPCPQSDLTECTNHTSERGWWTTRWESRMILYDPADMAKVAAGELESWEPQPYAYLSIHNRLYLNPSGIELNELGSGEQRRYIIGDAAFDRTHGLLYVLELFADQARPVVHVWRVS
jgi:hypothetical protein